MSRGTTTTSFRIPPPARMRYHRAAHKLDVDLSDLVRQLLDEVAEEQLGPIDKDEQYAADLEAFEEAKAEARGQARKARVDWCDNVVETSEAVAATPATLS